MPDNDTLPNDQTENNQTDLDDEQVEIVLIPEEEETEAASSQVNSQPEETVSEVASTPKEPKPTIVEPEPPQVESEPMVTEPEAPQTASASTPTAAIPEKPAKDHTIRNIVIGLFALIFLLCCCAMLFALALYASGVLDPFLAPLI